jgi:hypothetical protein
MNIKHSKYKNSGIIFELLVRQITSDILENKDSPAKNILKKYFVKTELGREYRLYETLLKKTLLTETRANIVISSLTDISKSLNRSIIKKQKYNLINEIKMYYDLNTFFNHKLPNYKVFAAFYTLLEMNNSNIYNPNQMILNKVTILEHLTAAKINPSEILTEEMQEFEKADKDVKFLTYKILMDKFNTKYDDFSPNQKQILKEYITSVDNTPKLKEFYSTKLSEIKSELTQLNKKTKNEITKIKITEIISIIEPPAKNAKITDDNLVDLLQYCDLINELKSANGKA